MSRLLVSFSVACALIFASCSETTQKSVKDEKSLVDQLGELEPAATVSFDELKGSTNTEKLLYLLDMPNSVKAATLIVLDGQVSSFEATGDLKSANRMRESRELLIQAADEKMDDYIQNVSKVYECFFTPEEIDYLIKIYTEPAMQKMIKSQVELQQKVIPVAEAWGQDAGVRYGELLKAKAKEEK